MSVHHDINLHTLDEIEAFYRLPFIVYAIYIEKFVEAARSRRRKVLVWIGGIQSDTAAVTEMLRALPARHLRK